MVCMPGIYLLLYNNNDKCYDKSGLFVHVRFVCLFQYSIPHPPILRRLPGPFRQHTINKLYTKVPVIVTVSCCSLYLNQKNYQVYYTYCHAIHIIRILYTERTYRLLDGKKNNNMMIWNGSEFRVIKERLLLATSTALLEVKRLMSDWNMYM